jgi:hypothetical protein
MWRQRSPLAHGETRASRRQFAWEQAFWRTGIDADLASLVAVGEEGEFGSKLLYAMTI